MVTCSNCGQTVPETALQCFHCHSLQDGRGWVRCRVCKNAIPAAAQKCSLCDSFQDWRSHFNFSSVVLSLLVALVSVLTAAVPVLRDALTPALADVQYDILTCSTDEVRILASNVGSRFAIVDGAAFEQIVGARSTNRFRLQVEGDKRIVRPQQSEEIVLVPIGDQLFPRGDDPNSGCSYKVRLSVRTLGVDSARSSEPKTCPCPT